MIPVVVAIQHPRYSDDWHLVRLSDKTSVVLSADELYEQYDAVCPDC